MKKHRWIAWGTSVLLAGVLVTLWAFSESGAGARLALTFIGYTNELLTATTDIPRSLTRDVWLVSRGDTFDLRPEGFTVPTALLSVTNSGSVRLEVFAASSPGSFTATGFARPSAKALPRILKPGESIIIKVIVDPREGPWWTEIGYQPRALRDRIYGWAWDRGNAKVKTWIAPKLPDITLVKFGPVTNEPPSGYTPVPVGLPDRLRPILRPNPRLEDMMF